MPYDSNDALPPSVRDHLPLRAQAIFREAFNQAFVRYGGDESIAFRIAWAAVTRRYSKVGGEWMAKDR